MSLLLPQCQCWLFFDLQHEYAWLTTSKRPAVFKQRESRQSAEFSLLFLSCSSEFQQQISNISVIVWVSGCDLQYTGENLKVFKDDLFSYFCYKPSYLKVFEVVSGDEFELTFKFGIRDFSLVPFFCCNKNQSKQFWKHCNINFSHFNFKKLSNIKKFFKILLPLIDVF